MTTEQMARELVRRGLADPGIASWNYRHRPRITEAGDPGISGEVDA